MGWIGSTRQLEHALAVVGADRAADGRFWFKGEVVTGLGRVEVVVNDDAVYFKDGVAHSMVELMASTGGGTRVSVVGEKQ